MDYGDLTIIIPTINEAGNIGILIRLLTKKYKNVHIIVTDDGSNDGTKEIVKGLGAKNHRIRFLDRANARAHGATASVLDAVLLVRTPYFVLTDGDMQHPIEKIAIIHKQLQKNDLVVAVRTKIEQWNLHRRLLSGAAIILAYAVFISRRKPIVKDMMSGFWGMRAKLLQSLIRKNRGRFVAHGGKILLDVLRVIDKNARIAQVPYANFHPRREGKSKYFGIRQIILVFASIIKR